MYGWQSTVGSRNQLILDTLFVELVNPPKPVKFDRLPDNVVPLICNMTSTLCDLPDDSPVLISRSQVDVLPNFSMTDYASQGKTRVNNVVDLNNSRTHQAYYTALSRSASAAGTLIVQGFDTKTITGGASGALCQEFRALEVLDYITKLRYESKLPKRVTGTYRHEFLSSFREWKGGEYVPSKVHKAIRWSRKDPYILPPVSDIEKSGSNQIPLATQVNTLKRKRSMGEIVLSNKRPKSTALHVHFDSIAESVTGTSVQPARQRIQIGSTRPQSPVSLPLGLCWHANSCAYDSVLTILFNLWAENPDLRERQYFQNNSEYLVFLTANFRSIYDGTQQFEKVRDILRCLLQWKWPEHFVWGHGTSIHELLDKLLTSDDPNMITELYCPRHHFVNRPGRRIMGSCVTVLYDATDIQALLDNMEIPTSTPCATCQMHLVRRWSQKYYISI